MSQADKEYIRLVEDILENGEKREDRTGTGTLSRFGTRMVFDLQKGFPLLTTKKVNLRLVFEELRWFLLGSTDLKWLLDRNVNIWSKDGYRFYKENGGTKNRSEERRVGKECRYRRRAEREQKKKSKKCREQETR